MATEPPKKKRNDDDEDWWLFFEEELEKVRRYIIRAFEKYKIKVRIKAVAADLKVTQDLYTDIEEKAESFYLRLARYYFWYAGGKGSARKRYDDEWLMEYLEFLDPVTGYRYYSELDRKIYRAYEEVLSQITANVSPAQRIDRCMSLLNKQITQKAIGIVLQTVIDAYKSNGIQKVRWYTMMDERVCDECRPRHGQIFDINKLPERHYYCRCWTIPVVENDKVKPGNT